jgi:hypothetical protein
MKWPQIVLLHPKHHGCLGRWWRVPEGGGSLFVRPAFLIVGGVGDDCGLVMLVVGLVGGWARGLLSSRPVFWDCRFWGVSRSAYIAHGWGRCILCCLLLQPFSAADGLHIAGNFAQSLVDDLAGPLGALSHGAIFPRWVADRARGSGVVFGEDDPFCLCSQDLEVFDHCRVQDDLYDRGSHEGDVDQPLRLKLLFLEDASELSDRPPFDLVDVESHESLYRGLVAQSVLQSDVLSLPVLDHFSVGELCARLAVGCARPRGARWCR